MVDEGKIAFTPAVELSFLNDTEQADLVEVIEVCEATPNLSQAQRLKKISQGEGLVPEDIAEILNEQKANQKERIKIPTEKLRKYFPKRYTATDMEKEIFAMLEKRYKEKQKDAR